MNTKTASDASVKWPSMFDVAVDVNVNVNVDGDVHVHVLVHVNAHVDEDVDMDAHVDVAVAANKTEHVCLYLGSSCLAYDVFHCNYIHVLVWDTDEHVQHLICFHFLLHRIP